MENTSTTVDFDVGKFSEEALRDVLLAIKHANTLPSAGEEYDECSVARCFRQVMDVESKKICMLMEKILQQQRLKVKLSGLDVDEMFEVLVDANDSLMERVGTSVDEATGLRKKEDPVVLTSASTKIEVAASWNKKGKFDKQQSAVLRLLTGRNIQRPQLKFKDKVDNSHGPFVPIIKEKPNSIKPLAIILEHTEYGEMYSHPYKCELDHVKIHESHLNKVVLEKPKSIEDTRYEYVDTPEKVLQLVSELKQMKEIAVDLEHHSYRSFLGITCLMQISTREADYLVDTLELRSDLQPLNDVFTDPKIMKVFHGSDSDIEWLQRDLGVYVVNMFDTGQASRLLNFARFSLSFLLKHYCDVDAEKQYQLADWRIRPLPDELVRYAREDTHYLLYIYDCMKNELLDKGNEHKNLLMSVLQQSKLLCEKRYMKPVFNSDSFMSVYQRSRKVFNTRQLFALRELYRWRDAVARAHDESFGYVLPNHMLLQIAEVLPREQQGILASCNPVPPLVRQNLNELHAIVLTAREVSLVKPVEQELQIKIDERRRQFDMDNVFHCPHDFSHLNENEPATHDAEPTILDLWNKYGDNLEEHLIVNRDNGVPTKQSTTLTAIAPLTKTTLKRKAKTSKSGLVVSLEFKKYCSPFKRYKLVCPLLKKAICETQLANDNAAAEAAPAKYDIAVDAVYEHFKKLVAIHGDGAAMDDSTKSDVVENGVEEAEEVAPLAPRVTKKKKSEWNDSVTSNDVALTEKKGKKKKKVGGKRKREERCADSSYPLDESLKQEGPKPAKKSKGEKTSKKAKSAVAETQVHPEEKTDQSTEGQMRFVPFDYSKVSYPKLEVVEQKKKKQKKPFGQRAKKMKFDFSELETTAPFGSQQHQKMQKRGGYPHFSQERGRGRGRRYDDSRTSFATKSVTFMPASATPKNQKVSWPKYK